MLYDLGLIHDFPYISVTDLLYHLGSAHAVLYPFHKGTLLFNPVLYDRCSHRMSDNVIRSDIFCGNGHRDIPLILIGSRIDLRAQIHAQHVIAASPGHAGIHKKEPYEIIQLIYRFLRFFLFLLCAIIILCYTL